MNPHASTLCGLAIVAVGAFGCSRQNEQAVSRGLPVVFACANAPEQYAKGFTTFVAFGGDNGVQVPMRWALSPRRGVMDTIQMKVRAQDPVFWAQDATRVDFSPVAGVDDVFVGWREPQSKAWTIYSFKLADVKAENGEIIIPVATFNEASRKLDSSQASEVLNALAKAEQATNIQNREP